MYFPVGYWCLAYRCLMCLLNTITYRLLDDWGCRHKITMKNSGTTSAKHI